MTSIENFYDELDLKYPEIAIAIDKIDRLKPKNIRFIIPILTPYMNTNKAEESTIYQNKQNLMNAEKDLLEVNNIKTTNYIKMNIPKELCSICDGEFELYDKENNKLKAKVDNTSTGSVSMSGTVDEYSISVSGSLSFNGNESIDEISGTFKIRPTEKFRYIPEGSKWIVVFIGGDITKPQIIGRYLESSDSEENDEESTNEEV